MKRYVVVLLLLLLLPMTIKAECNYQRQVELGNVANRVTYDRTYSRDTGMFSIKLYNIVNSIYVKYNSLTYHGDDSNEVSIGEVQEGTYMSVLVYASSTGCSDSLSTVYINIPYYNPYYESEECSGYDMLTVCNSQFLTYKVDRQIIDSAINNYNNKIHNEPAQIASDDPTMLDNLKEFASTWGLKIILVLLTVGVCIAYYQVKLRQAKHGI